MPSSVLVISDGDRATLESWTRSSTVSAGQRERAEIVLAVAGGVGVSGTARTLGMSRPTVIKWRERYATCGVAGLADLPRSGRPKTIDDAAIIAATMEPPPDSLRVSGGSAVYITHDQAEAFALGDEVGVLQGGRLVQVGSPEEIYRTPAEAFVARFTGLAGELSGRVLGPSSRSLQAEALQTAAVPQGERSAHAPDWIRVAIASADPGACIIDAAPMAQLRAGAAVQVLIRTPAVRLCEAVSGEADLAGVVKDVAFCGRGYEYVIELGRGLELSGLFAERRLQRGYRCGLALHPSGCLAFAADAAAPGAGPLPAAALPRAGARPLAATDVGADPVVESLQ